MKNEPHIDRYFSGTVYRLLSGLFGIFLVVVGIYAVFFGVVDLSIRIALGLLIAMLGAETVWAAVWSRQSRQSWLAQLGPFL